MSLLDELKSIAQDKGALVKGMKNKKILIYGANDCGKTYQSMHLEKPLLLMTESGGSAFGNRKRPITTWSSFCQMTELLTGKHYKEMRELYSTIIIDTIENLINLSERATCNEFEGARDLSEINGKKNGYRISRNNFDMQINKLCSLDYCIIFIAHEELLDHNPKTLVEEPYIQPTGTINKKTSMSMITNLCDFVIYVRPNGIDPETYKTIPSTAICKETKNTFARSRFDIQTFIDPFTADGLKEAIEKAVEKSAEQDGFGVEEYKEKKTSYTKQDYFDMIAPYVKRLSKNFANEISNIIESELGEGRKITSADDDEIINLDNIYNRLVTLATSLDITV